MQFRVRQSSVTFKNSLISNRLSSFVHSGCRAAQNSTPPRSDLGIVVEREQYHLDYIIDGIAIFHASACIHVPAIEQDFGHDWRQFFLLPLLVDLC